MVCYIKNLGFKKIYIKYIYIIILAFQHNGDVSLKNYFRRFKKEAFNKS